VVVADAAFAEVVLLEVARRLRESEVVEQIVIPVVDVEERHHGSGKIVRRAGGAELSVEIAIDE
jgi:hypothetical protein